MFHVLYIHKIILRDICTALPVVLGDVTCTISNLILSTNTIKFSDSQKKKTHTKKWKNGQKKNTRHTRHTLALHTHKQRAKQIKKKKKTKKKNNT